MSTVAAVMDRAARMCRVDPPTNWMLDTSTTYADLKDALAETVDELLQRVDWPDPITRDVTITGTGAETYPLPSDFKRLTRDSLAVYETTTTRRAGIPVRTNGEWTLLKDLGSAGGDRYYRVSGDEDNGFEISFYREPQASDNIIVSYVSKNWLAIGGIQGDEWTDASATLLLPQSLIVKGVVWRFRRDKGLSYADRLNEYEADLSRRANDMRGVRKINMGGPTTRSPFDIPVPDYIPPA